MASDLANKILKLKPADRERAINALRRKRAIECEESYYEFFKDAWRVIEPTTKLNLPLHIEYLCDTIQEHFEDLIYRGVVNYDVIVINVPPGQTKSSVFTKILNAWIWIKDPSFRVITSSYSSDLSLSQARKTRDVILSDWYQHNWGNIVQLKGDLKKISEYATSATGMRMSTSTGGGGTGFHCRLWIDDDPLNVKKAESKLLRNEAIRHSDKTVPTRVKNGFRIMVMQRLHHDDPTGNILRKKEQKVLHIKLPATSDGDVLPLEARKLYINGYLDPVGLGEKELRKHKEDLGSVGYAQQMMQETVPEGGNIIHTDWFDYIEPFQVPLGLEIDMWIDGAYTKSTSNDPTGIMICSYDKKTKTLYVLYFKGEYLEMPELLKKVNDTATEFNLNTKSKIYIEPKASGKSLKQMINSTYGHLSAVEIKNHLVQEGKQARAQIASPKFEASKIKCVKGNWNDEFETQLTGFPNVAHDEAIDLTGYAIHKYFFKPVWTGQSF